MRFEIIVAAALAALAVAGPARAELVSATPATFLVRAEADVSAAPSQAYVAITQPRRWWSSAHTYSGDAANLRLTPRAGGCWCETWDHGQSVEHMRVVAVIEHEGVRTIRLAGGLGPLQEMGVNAVMTLTVTPREGGSKVTMTYRVAGEPGLALDQVAAPVDAVLMEQFGRLTRLLDGGAP
ncbi:SRPBCC domain-containing protein [Terricaulis sp.]|uniref:SRPBCC domain-containing protein n=1 Tax=Terricaulis sp. TaxID=2768686 RepID=UPI00378329D1